MKNELKGDEEIIAQDGDITISMKELKTSLPKLLEKIKIHSNSYDLIKKMMLLIKIRFEIIQHTLKPIINDSIEVLRSSKETMQETNKILDEIKEQLKKLKENE